MFQKSSFIECLARRERYDPSTFIYILRLHDSPFSLSLDLQWSDFER